MAFAIVAFSADRLGIGQPGSFGSGQLLLGMIGLALVLIAWLGRRSIELYRSVAVYLLNTLLLLVALELTAIVIARLGAFPTARDRILAQSRAAPDYAARHWSETYWRESALAERYRYKPYVIWSHQPFVGETVNVSEEGVRHTPGADCKTDSYTVFAFGGSSLWGWGAADWETIAAHLQSGLAETISGPVCVVNFGEDGYVSTQSLVALLLQLRAGERPDAVIFHDGFNDVYAAYQSGQSGVHLDLADIAAQFESREHPLVSFLRSSRLFWLGARLIGSAQSNSLHVGQASAGSRPLGTEAKGLAIGVARTYLSNYETVSILAHGYGFEHFFFWQPHLAVGTKPLAAAEHKLAAAMDPALMELARAVYAEIRDSASEYDRLWYIADAFDGETEQIWIDPWGHTTPYGNFLVAQTMTAIMQPQLPAR